MSGITQEFDFESKEWFSGSLLFNIRGSSVITRTALPESYHKECFRATAERPTGKEGQKYVMGTKTWYWEYHDPHFLVRKRLTMCINETHL